MGFIIPLISAGTALYSAYKKSKAGDKAAEAIESAKVDPATLAQTARTEGVNNIRASLEAEREFTPENQLLRTNATKALLPLINDPGETVQISQVDEQINDGGTAEQSDLFTESVAEARRQLQLGGQLDSETRNEISRRAIARGGNTGNARYTTPRDLGLSSLQLATDRLERGGRFGAMDQGRNQQSFDNLARLRQLRASLSQTRQNRAVQLAGFGQALQAPDIGLDPGEIAGVEVGNQNLTAQAGVQRAQNSANNAQNWAKAINAGAGAIKTIFDED